MVDDGGMKTEDGVATVQTGQPPRRASEMRFMRSLFWVATVFGGTHHYATWRKGRLEVLPTAAWVLADDSPDDTIFGSLRSLPRARQYPIGFYFDPHGAMTRA
jgi:hypothetical protein